MCIRDRAQQQEEQRESAQVQADESLPAQLALDRPPAPPQEELPPPDNPPEARDDSFEVNVSESTVFDVLANDIDPDQDQLLVIDELDTSGLEGSVTILDGVAISYTPPQGLESLPGGATFQETFEYAVVSGQLGDSAAGWGSGLGVRVR